MPGHLTADTRPRRRGAAWDRLRVCIVGAGVVGGATGRGLRAQGHAVTYVDVNPGAVARLRREGATVFLPSELSGRDDGCDVTFFSVCTPTGREGQINLEPLRSAVRDAGERLRHAQSYRLYVVRSTVPPGTTEAVGALLTETSGKSLGREFGLCMNPEYLRERSAEEDFRHPWIIVVGELDRRSGDLLERLYRPYACPRLRVSLREAEMQKYVHNLFNATKVTFFNEFREVCKRVGIDAAKIFPLVAQSAEGMWNPTYGVRDLGPFDGSCLPKDTQAFLAWAREQEIAMPLLEATIRANDAHREAAPVQAERAPASTSSGLEQLAPAAVHE